MGHRILARERSSQLRCTTSVSTSQIPETTLASTSRVWTKTTCLDQATSWSTRRTLHWDRPRSSRHRSRCSTSPTRSSALFADWLRALWKMGKETGGKKMEDPHSLKSNEMAECAFQPQQP